MKRDKSGWLFERFGNVAFECGSILCPLQHNAAKESSGFCHRQTKRRFGAVFETRDCFLVNLNDRSVLLGIFHIMLL